MIKYWVFWVLSIPLFMISYVYSFFMTNKMSYWRLSDCRPKFIFTPEDVSYCSDIYVVDVILLSLKTNPISYFCLAFGAYLIGFLVYQLVKVFKRALTAFRKR